MTPLRFLDRLGSLLPALWISAGALIITGQEAPMAVILAALALAVVAGPRVSVSRGVEWMLATFAALAAVAVAFLLPAKQNLLGVMAPRAIHVAVALAPLAVTAVRTQLKTPWEGPRATVALSLFGAIGLGGRPLPGIYAPFLVGVFLTAIVAFRRADRRPHLPAIGARHLGFSALILGVTAAVTLGLASALPPLHDRVQAYAIENLAFDMSTRSSGFSRAMGLGGLKKIIRSDERVFRVYGAQVDHLRGVVYDRYRDGRWFVPLDATQRTIDVPTEPPAGARVVEIEALGPETAAFFVPLQAEGIAVPDGRIAVDDLGVYTPLRGMSAERIWYQLGARPLDVRPPTPIDVNVPPELAESLRPLMERWTKGAQSDAARLEMIRRHLQSEYEYALEFEVAKEVDPVLEFLLERRTGHCEYFASAMTLLARTSTIPARVVGGFLVTERSEVGDYWIVRSSNAHAWVEAWVDGAWVTYDPTPPGGLLAHMAKTAPWPEAVADWFRGRAGRTLDWLKARTVGQLLFGLALGLLFVFRKELRSLWGGRAAAEDGPGYGPSSAGLSALLDRLAREGLLMKPGETLSQLAGRAPQEAAALLQRYVALRYGGIGDSGALERDLAAYVGRDR